MGVGDYISRALSIIWGKNILPDGSVETGVKSIAARPEYMPVKTVRDLQMEAGIKEPEEGVGRNLDVYA